jgi:hypothetical protein
VYRAWHVDHSGLIQESGRAVDAFTRLKEDAGSVGDDRSVDRAGIESRMLPGLSAGRDTGRQEHMRFRYQHVCTRDGLRSSPVNTTQRNPVYLMMEYILLDDGPPILTMDCVIVVLQFGAA